MSRTPPKRPGPAALLLVAVALAGAPLACKTTQQAVSELRAVEAKAVQCDPVAGFRGSCQVLEVSGRLGTTTEAARASGLGDVTELRLLVPATAANGHAQVQFFRKTGLVEAWTVSHAVDLYDRKGCIAEVNGGVFENGFTPRLTARVLMNLTDDGRTAFAEVSDYDTGVPIQAMLALRCDWQT